MLEKFELTQDQLEDIRDALRGRIQEGLAASGREIKALPAFLPYPDPELKGTATVVDAGGTNMRAALVQLKGGGEVEVVAGPIKDSIPDGREQRVTAEQFFQAQAELVRKLAPPPKLPLGYCFSYPAETLPTKDARLLRWTKGVDIPGVEGTMVGARLQEAIRRAGLEPGPVSVMNDTVASLLGGGVVHARGQVPHYIGLIVGTGTNMAALFSIDQISKVAAADWPADKKMCINLESGNFHPPHLTEWDDQVDASSDQPGTQRFEKAVSGYYLPFLLEVLCPDLPGFDPRKGTQQLVALRERGEGEAAEAARLLLQRSADLVAAALVAVMDHYGPGDVGILAEGSLIWGDPLYRDRVEATMARLLKGERKARIIEQRKDVNLIGAAGAALSG
ncbi:MAG: hypothetical protein HY319_14710 [Armatimonadetes bacterium]|nr:hypothetical protein [Armatimonadota bacterium]